MTTTTKTEPTIGNTLGGLFSSKKKIKPVTEILGGLTQLVSDLKGAMDQHKAKIGENDTKINDLKKEIEASEAEIAAAAAAHANISGLLGLPVAPVEPAAPVESV